VLAHLEGGAAASGDLGGEQLVQDLCAGRAERLAKRLVSAAALVDGERVQPRFVDPVKQDFHSSVSSIGLSTGADGPGRSGSSTRGPRPAVSDLGVSGGGGPKSAAPSATPGSAPLRNR